MLKGFKPLWKTAAVAVVVLVVLLFLANGQRMRRLEQIRNELGQVEPGMTRQEVRDALMIQPRSKSKPDKTTGSDDIVVGEHRSDEEATWSGD